MKESRWLIGPANPEQRTTALRLLVGDARAAGALDLIAAGEVDPSGLFVACDGARIIAAFACLSMPGANSLVWPPAGQEEAFDPLIEHGLSWLRSKRVKLAQSIVTPADASRLAPLHRWGFTPAGPMLFYRHDLVEGPFAFAAAEHQLTPLADISPSQFAQTLERTYHETLDFPELAGARSMNDVMTAIEANPALRPKHSRVAFVDGQPAGILLVGELEALAGWDLNYLGVVPEMRRRGVGRALATAAIEIVADAGGSHLDVAVDARNRPAIQLYAGLGFQLVEERPVSLIFLQPAEEDRESP